MTLVNLVYEKLTELSGFSIKEASIGKILNLVSGDINALEHLFITMFQSSVLPITFGYASAILWVFKTISVAPLRTHRHARHWTAVFIHA